MTSYLQQFADKLKPNKSTTSFGGYSNDSSKTTPFNIFKNNLKRTSPSPPNMTSFRTGQATNASPSPIPSSPGNTGTTTPKLSSAGQEFARNSLGSYKGVEINSGSSVEDQIRGIDNPQQNTPPPLTNNKPSDKQDYIDSLKAEQFPTSYKAEMDARNKAAERLAKVQSDREKMEVDARREYEKTLDAPGGTVAAAQQGATLARRRSNTELADVALQESVALRAAQVSQGILESAQERDRQLTLEEIQALNDNGANLPFGSTISQAMTNGAVTTSESGGTSASDVSGMAQMVANGTMDIANVPTELRGRVSTAVGGLGGINKPTSPYLKDIADNGLNAVGGLLEIAERNPGIFGRTAALPLPDALRTDDYRDYEGQLESLRGNIIPATLTAMREASTTGGALGQVSDREGAWLASSLGALSMKQSPASVIKQLRLIETRLKQWQGAAANPESITANYILPDGTKLGDVHPEYFDGSQGGGSIWDSGENWD